MVSVVVIKNYDISQSPDSGVVNTPLRWTLTIIWLPVDAQVQRAALPWMKKFADQGVSFVDATSFALMRRENIRHVFSFDRHFATAGFRLWPV